MLNAQVPRGVTVLSGVTVGHDTMSGRPTGCTVILFRDGAVGGVDVRGAAPGTRETDLLDPVNTVERINALVFAGGSAFGLDAAGGVMRFLEEREIGYDVGVARVPIVPAAILFDLAVGSDPRIHPDAACGYRAAESASAGFAEGSVGAGTGATVGKLAGISRAMKGGVGSSLIEFPSGLRVAALVVVNSLGDVVDPVSGQVLAGTRTADGKSLVDVRQLIREGKPFATLSESTPSHTTLGLVVTNAPLTKSQATLVARMAHDGYARTIYPVHTAYDGDIVFAAATGLYRGEFDMVTLGAAAQEVISAAIVRAITQASGLPGLPSARELGSTR